MLSEIITSLALTNVQSVILVSSAFSCFYSDRRGHIGSLHVMAMRFPKGIRYKSPQGSWGDTFHPFEVVSGVGGYVVGLTNEYSRTIRLTPQVFETPEDFWRAVLC